MGVLRGFPSVWCATPHADSTRSSWWCSSAWPCSFPSLAAAIRRLHDNEQEGWWLLIVLIVLLAAQPTPGSNEYGVTAAGP
jgi:hypothetical protein